MGIRESVVTEEQRISEVSLLVAAGQITVLEYKAGIEYATKILDYLKTIDAPSPYGADLSDYSDERCLGLKLGMAGARETLSRAGKQAARIVDRVMVYGEPIGDGELFLLRRGLKVLAK